MAQKTTAQFVIQLAEELIHLALRQVGLVNEKCLLAAF